MNAHIFTTTKQNKLNKPNSNCDQRILTKMAYFQINDRKAGLNESAQKI